MEGKQFELTSIWYKLSLRYCERDFENPLPHLKLVAEVDASEYIPQIYDVSVRSTVTMTWLRPRRSSSLNIWASGSMVGMVNAACLLNATWSGWYQWSLVGHLNPTMMSQLSSPYIPTAFTHRSKILERWRHHRFDFRLFFLFCTTGTASISCESWLG